MTRRQPTTWPDTTSVPPPADHPYASATWLLGRHPTLAALVDRLPGVAVTNDTANDDAGDGPWLEDGLLADGITAFDAHQQAWREYRSRTWEPPDDGRWQDWQAAGPRWPDTPAGAVGRQIACMSRTERVRLRLLAAFACDGARLAVGMLTGFDAAGQALINDWLEAIRHA